MYGSVAMAIGDPDMNGKPHNSTISKVYTKKEHPGLSVELT